MSVRANAVDRYDEIELRVHPVAPDDEIRARLLAEGVARTRAG